MSRFSIVIVFLELRGGRQCPVFLNHTQLMAQYAIEAKPQIAPGTQPLNPRILHTQSQIPNSQGDDETQGIRPGRCFATAAVGGF